ncbi:MAG: LytR C-terminal domain-containing protein [Actinomycetota bacterium]|nr:LytR C-terminal domain-containing protein [Actinomycetota bacterium]
MNGRHAIPGDRGFAASLVRSIASAVALVTLVATAFWGIGRFQPAVELGDAGDGEGAALEGPPVAHAAPAEEETDYDPPLLPSTLTPSPTASFATPTPSPSSSPTLVIAPSRVSVQVLDAAGDGGVRARRAVSRLRADGYNVVATNEASRIYPRTEVMYSPGKEAAARQIAAAYGLSAVRSKPSNLTSAVDVHLVIGRDYQAR